MNYKIDFVLKGHTTVFTRYYIKMLRQSKLIKILYFSAECKPDFRAKNAS